jgi:hypothetical protein
MKRISTLILLAAAAALLVAACGAGDDGATAIPTTPATPPVAATEPAFQSPVQPGNTPEPAFQSPVQPGEAPAAASPERAAASAAIDDLAGRLGVAPEAIAVVEVNEVEWPDASLGCPAPDMGYAQVITPGVQVILESGGQTFDYHGRSLGDLFLCGPDGPVAPAP